MERTDLYNYPRRLELALAKMRQDKEVCEENKKAIEAFSKTRLAKGSGHGRVGKVVYCLRFISHWLRTSFAKATKDDLISLVGDLESNSKYAEHTKYDFKIVLKMFYKWLKGNDEEFPQEVKWLKPALKNENHKLPEDLLSEDEVLKLANTADNLRDKALILVLYEAGCRIGELLSLKIKNVSFDQYGAVLRVTGKTGDRRVRVISSAPILASWLNMHPKPDDHDAMLWYSSWGKKRNDAKCLRHGTVYTLIRELAVRAGIKKNVHPHLFRHSRATSLAGKLTEAQMKEYFGWVQGSDMAATYVHLSGRDVDNALLKLHGLAKPEEEKEDIMKVKSCQRCKEHNSPIAKFCIKCGLPLDQEFIAVVEKERQNSDNLMNKLMEDRDFKELMLKKILEMGLQKSLNV